MKRKIFILFFIVFFILISGCEIINNTSLNNNNLNNDRIEITSVYLDSEVRGIKYIVSIDFDKLYISKEDIISYGLVIINKDITNVSDITYIKRDRNIELYEIENDVLTFTISGIDKNNFNTPYSVRAYIKYKDKVINKDSLIYSNFYVKHTPYELAKLSDSNFSKEITSYVERKKLSTIQIDVDTVNDVITNSAEGYHMSLTKMNNIFTVTFTINPGYSVDDDVKIVINGIEISLKDCVPSNGSLSYSFEDPTTIS